MFGAFLHVAVGDAAAAVEHGQLDVFQRGGAGEEVEALEDEPELLVAQVGKLVAVETGDVHAVEQVAARGGPVEAAERVHERGLAGAAGAHDGHKLALVQLQGDAADGVHLHLARIVDAVDVLKLDDGGHAEARGT